LGQKKNYVFILKGAISCSYFILELTNSWFGSVKLGVQVVVRGGIKIGTLDMEINDNGPFFGLLVLNTFQEKNPKCPMR
jgi:hypothetical protein